jgi:hypothetical protein
MLSFFTILVYFIFENQVNFIVVKGIENASSLKIDSFNKGKWVGFFPTYKLKRGLGRRLSKPAATSSILDKNTCELSW